MDPRNADVHIRIAPLYIRTGRKDRAKASLRLATAWYEKRGFVDKAIATLRLIVTIDRRDLASCLHLADLYLERGLAGDARVLLEQARRAFSGWKYRDEALKIEEKILALDPDDFRVQCYRARLLWSVGRRREALDRLQQMEEEWFRKGNRGHWRKTRLVLFRLAPSLSAGRDYLLSLVTSPVPLRPLRGS